MLEEQLWIKYEHELSIDWKQSYKEGKDVEYLKDICDSITKRAKTENVSEIACEIGKLMDNAAMREDYKYEEPSEYEAIVKQKPKRRHSFTNNISDSVLKDKLLGAWIGRISGCLLGKPVEGWKRKEMYQLLKASGNFPVTKYMYWKDLGEENQKKYEKSLWADRVNGVAPIDDDTNYTVLALKLVEQYGKDFRPNDVLETWLCYMPVFATCTAERVAYRNAATGMYAPQTALYKNPYREMIGAQIRADFFGYINPADTEKAAEMAWRDAYVSHVKNGIYGEMFAAAMISAAFVCSDIIKIIQAGLDEIPEKSRLRDDVELVLKWHADGITQDEAIENIHKIFNEYDPFDWCYTNSNAMIVVAALLYGNKDFGKSVSLAVQAAFDTDCNGATVGSVLGAMLGCEGIPLEWYACYNKRLATSILGYTETTADELAEKTFNIIKGK